MNVGAILDVVAGELDAQVLGYMQEYAIPPSLMDKVLDRIQSHMRQMKSEEYAAELKEMQLEEVMREQGVVGSVESPAKLMDPEDENHVPESGTETDTIEGFKEKMGMSREGDGKDADVQCKTGK